MFSLLRYEDRPGRPTPRRRAPIRALSLFLLAAGLSLACASGRHVAPAADPGEDVRLVVLHTNDVHGQVQTREAFWLDREDSEPAPQIGGLPRLAAYVASVRAELSDGDRGLLVLDAGDWYQGTPEGWVDRGLPFASALVDVGYDAMCVGNHEFDHGVPNLERLLAEARPPAVLANVRDPRTGLRVPWVQPFRIVEVSGVRIALVGLVDEHTPDITHPDARELLFTDPVEEFGLVLGEIGDRADLVLPLTHIGVKSDERLARAYPDLPLIIGGHSHTYLKSGRRVGETLIAQAGSKASGVGRIELRYRPATGAVLEGEARIIDLLAEPEERDRVSSVESACAELVEQAAAEMDQVVGSLAGPLSRSRGIESSSAGNLITDVMRRSVGTDVAIQNRGGIRRNVPAGTITRRDLFELLPFGNTLVILEISGAHLEDTVRRAVEGQDHSGIEFSGMRVRIRPREEQPAELLSVEVGDEPLDPGRVYRLATNSFLVGGGDAYLDPDWAHSTIDTGRKLREILAEAFELEGQLKPSRENRYLSEEEAVK